MTMDHIPAAMDRHLDFLKFHSNGGLLVGASGLTGRYWLGSLWYYAAPEAAPDVESCSAGVQLEAGLQDAAWVDTNRVLLALDTGGVALWELQDDCKTFAMLQSACEHDHITSSVSVNADGSQFVSASHDKGIKIWNTELVSLSTYRAYPKCDLSVTTRILSNFKEGCKENELHPFICRNESDKPKIHTFEIIYREW